MSDGCAEFVLARLDREEEIERRVLAADDVDEAEAGTWLWVRRDRADRAAKRRIVANAQRHTPGERGYGAANYPVRCLAMIWADHPDYQGDRWLL